MAGHSQFKNIMHRKSAQDAKRAKIFGKHIREITVAARQGGADPDGNPRLRTAILAARAVNMPKDTIERAARRGAGGEGTGYEEVRYEGFGPGGVAVLVEALTDNRNRTVAEVRAAFGKNGGNLGEAGSVSHMFERVGVIAFAADAADAEAMLEAAIEAGATDCQSDAEGHTIVCAPDDLGATRQTLEDRFGEPERAQFEWRPTVSVPIGEDDAETLFRLLGALDDSDDVQRTFANFDIAADVMDRLSA